MEDRDLSFLGHNSPSAAVVQLRAFREACVSQSGWLVMHLLWWSEGSCEELEVASDGDQMGL